MMAKLRVIHIVMPSYIYLATECNREMALLEVLMPKTEGQTSNIRGHVGSTTLPCHYQLAIAKVTVIRCHTFFFLPLVATDLDLE